MRSHPRSEEELARMWEISEQLPGDLAGLVEKLSDPDFLVRRQAATKLGGLEDPLAVGPLMKAMEDEHQQVRATAALALGRYEDTQALPAILDHLENDPSPSVRRMCAFAAGTMGTDEAMEGLKAALSDPDEDICMTACWPFAHRKDKRAVPEIRAMLDSSKPTLRSASACVLTLLGLADEQVMGVMMNDPVWEVRKEVAEEMIYVGVADQRIVNTIERLMREPEAEKYEAMVAQFRAGMEAFELAELSEPDEELSEEDRKELAAMEDEMPKPLAEILAKARGLIEEQSSQQ